MAEFSGKVVLVTGAGRGLGRLLAQAFADHGAIVAANDLTPINLDETLRLVRQAGGRIQEYLFDIAIRMQAQAMVDQIASDWGRLDVLINNAAVQPHFPLLDMDEWDWRRTLDVNLSGPFFLIQAAGRLMQRQPGAASMPGAAILNLGDYVGTGDPASGQSVQPRPGRAAYVASKYGLQGLTFSAARDLAAYQIRVNLLCPYQVSRESPLPPPQETASAAQWLEQAQGAGFSYHRQVDSPLAQPLISLALYLCSRACPHTGQVIPVALSPQEPPGRQETS
jgi:NAD(P)-dependent dehydrogenase (short-subunit alcohol dehydrogenase family)